MSLELCILASGSSGNSAIVRTPAGVIGIDAGIGPRTTAKRLADTGVALADLHAICLTHLDRDHFNPSWVNTLVSRKIRLHCHEGRVDQLIGITRDFCGSDLARQFELLIVPFGNLPFSPLPELALHPLRLAHDEAGSHGFLIQDAESRIGYATDLGHVPPELIELFNDADLLAIESNYDPKMQRESTRPWYLKQRIMGGCGHLSNEQAFEAVRRILDRSQARGRLPAHIVLLHRSRQCNCPKIVRKLFSRDPRIAPRLTLAEQFDRTEWLRFRRVQPLVGEQLSLAWV